MLLVTDLAGLLARLSATFPFRSSKKWLWRMQNPIRLLLGWLTVAGTA